MGTAHVVKTLKKFHESGLKTLPIKKDKSPASAVWLGGVSDEKQYTNAFGFGVACGSTSGGLEVLDFDCHFGDAKKIISDFITINEVSEIMKKYKLPIVSTQNGGYHIYFRSDFCGGNQKLASRPKLTEDGKRYRPDAIIETRGEGGYVVAPPTPKYKTIRNSIFDIKKITRVDRDILITAAKSFQEWDIEINNKQTKNRTYTNDERLGDRYDHDPDSILEAKNSLIRAGWKELQNGRWRRPGKKTGISATFGKVAQNVFYCFSSNGFPFDVSGYTPFQVVGLLEYDSNFKAFAKDLSQRYGANKWEPTKPHERVHSKKTETPEEADEYKNKMETMLASAFIDTSTPVPSPPTVISIRESTRGGWQRLGTLGNFSVLTGKAKSKKTMFSMLMTAACVGNSTIDRKSVV